MKEGLKLLKKQKTVFQQLIFMCLYKAYHEEEEKESGGCIVPKMLSR